MLDKLSRTNISCVSSLIHVKCFLKFCMFPNIKIVLEQKTELLGLLITSFDPLPIQPPPPICWLGARENRRSICSMNRIIVRKCLMDGREEKTTCELLHRAYGNWNERFILLFDQCSNTSPQLTSQTTRSSSSPSPLPYLEVSIECEVIVFLSNLEQNTFSGNVMQVVIQV